MGKFGSEKNIMGKSGSIKVKRVKYANKKQEVCGIREMIEEVFSDREILDHFDTFMDFMVFFNQLIECTVNEKVVENLVNRFFNDFLLSKLQPVLLLSDDKDSLRTCIQYLVHVVDISTSKRVVQTIFFFLFGFPDHLKPQVQEQKFEAEYENHDENEHNHQELNEEFDFLNNDDLMINQAPEEDPDFFALDKDFEISREEVTTSTSKQAQPKIRIGNELVSAPKDLEIDDSIRQPLHSQNTTAKRGTARSVSVFKVEDAKVELDLLDSILNSVENAELQVQQDLEEAENRDFECELKIDKHLSSEIGKSVMTAVISDHPFMATAALKLIEVFLKQGGETVTDLLVFKAIRYLSEDTEEGANICEYFEQEINEGRERHHGERDLIQSFKSKLPLIMMTLNPKNDFVFPDEDPLESGLLFAVLLKKFSQMLENTRIDNLILTEIWSVISSLALSKSKPETFYLYAFCFQDISANSKSQIGLFSSIEAIQRQISAREINDDIETLIFHRKKQMGLLGENAVEPISDCSQDLINTMIRSKTNLIDGCMIFYEFIKEYTMIGNRQKHTINMLKVYSDVWEEDQQLDRSLTHLG